MICVNCGSRLVGKIGVDQYYCCDCCVEFKSESNHVVVYNLEEDGTLVMRQDYRTSGEWRVESGERRVGSGELRVGS
ncbi:MAG: hypothetical protein LBK56_05770 [Gracilibacteraceae bacterium]|jgi:hypothetical protein|nr:hypothetical protein [Gracilibacteraceae bacterium]